MKFKSSAVPWSGRSRVAGGVTGDGNLGGGSRRAPFFDLLPLGVDTIGGMRIRLQLYTVPGQVICNTKRKSGERKRLSVKLDLAEGEDLV